MNELVKQITSYKIFNYLLPGAVFCWGMNHLFGYALLPESLFVAFFVFYFVGLVISRVGSIAFEPLLRLIQVAPRRQYSAYVEASQKDTFIVELSEANNVYRTLISLPVCMVIYHLGYGIADHFNWGEVTRAYIIVLFLALLFVFSYRKQSKYICDRIDIATNQQNKSGS